MQKCRIRFGTMCADEGNGRRSGRYTPRQSRRYNQQSPQYYQRHATSPHSTPRRGRAPAAHQTPRRSALQPPSPPQTICLHLAPTPSLSFLLSHPDILTLFDAVTFIMLLPPVFPILPPVFPILSEPVHPIMFLIVNQMVLACRSGRHQDGQRRSGGHSSGRRTRHATAGQPPQPPPPPLTGVLPSTLPSPLHVL